MNRILTPVLVLLAAISVDAQTITRAQAMQNAESFRSFQWTMNTASKKNCGAPSYISTVPFPAGSHQTGMAYCWGGGHRIDQFLSAVATNKLIGNTCSATSQHQPGTYGVDCSGFVTRAWGRSEYHFGTGQLAGNSLTTTVRGGIPNVRSGDIVVWPGKHVMLVNAYNPSTGMLSVVESTTDGGANRVRRYEHRWTTLIAKGYTPRRYLQFQDAGLGKVERFTIPTRIKATDTLSVAVTLRETDGLPIRYDVVTVAILDSSNQRVTDLNHHRDVRLAADGSVTLSFRAPMCFVPGTYRAVVRGYVGGWSDFKTTGSGTNNVAFTVVR